VTELREIVLKIAGIRADPRGGPECVPRRAIGAVVGFEAMLGWIGAFFGAGTLMAVMLCSSSGDADARWRQAVEADAEALARSVDHDDVVAR